jgi:hypothetical protein
MAPDGGTLALRALTRDEARRVVLVLNEYVSVE